jgi:predicted nucleotidyltransferase component of viral defense system
VKVDITINEVLCFPLQDRPIHRTYDNFNDLPEGPTIKVYDIKEIVVEKLLALSDRARNEPRDLYDLWYLFGSTALRTKSANCHHSMMYFVLKITALCCIACQQHERNEQLGDNPICAKNSVTLSIAGCHRYAG